MAKYFYTFEGRTLGPVSPQEIMSLILEDVLNNDSYVMDAKSPQWIKIKDIPELMRFLHESDFRLPTSDVNDEDLHALDEQAPVFFHIPISRLILCSIFTLGLYQFYWLYKNWHFLRWVRKDNSFGFSFWRDSINPFRLVKIFSKISLDKELNRAVPSGQDFGMYGVLWILTWPLSQFVFLIPVQNYINTCNAKLGRRYTVKSFGHYLVLVLGALGWLLILAGFIF